ncbi:adenylate kinase isoenzyme 1-like isoform X1 [Symphalangus syndactylus]|uniref:adenylate kinase isoenzyme 1-like isoform X1 n=1 Tax=Symphalangus syndactylus TaxID=9590 RepID=UPI00244180E6|nr:adenylate kinase isoenzyme 1-like isoform X3 [Symphalangus syndactylus]XP_055094247.1 adenylate kinase isoenzyme 1-like isoform X3 [Symphalangus syndactylus]
MTEAGTLVTLSQARRGQNLGGVGRDRPKSCWPDGSLQVQAARGGQGSEAPGEGHSQVPPIIFVMGGPGCGKGTQCKNMVTKYGFCHVGLGQLLRQEAQRSTQRGWQICDIMLQGLLMPAGIILDMVSDNMLSCLESRGFLIDGFPWELKQAMEFEHIVGRAPSVVTVFDCSMETMLRVLHQGQGEHRADDSELAIHQSLDTHYTVCEPVLTFYQQNNLLRNILAEEAPENIFAKCCSVIESLQ